MEDEKKLQLSILEMLIEIDKICKKYQLTYYLAYGSVLGAIRHKGFIPWDKDVDIMIEIDSMDKLISVLETNLPKKYKVYSIYNDDKYDSLKPRIGLANHDHHTLHVDIFPMVGLSNNNIIRNVVPRLSSLIYTIFFLKKFDADTYHKNNPQKRLKHRIAKAILYVIPINLLKKVFNYLSWKYPISESKYIFNICGSYGMREVIPKNYLKKPVYMEFEGYMLPVPSEWDNYLKHMYGDYMTPVKY